jgi:hypothetical protein
MWWATLDSNATDTEGTPRRICAVGVWCRDFGLDRRDGQEVVEDRPKGVQTE